MNLQHRTLSQSIISEGRLAGTFTGWGTQRVLTLYIDEEHNISVLSDTHEHDASVSGNDRKNFKPSPNHGAKLTLLRSISIAGCDLLGSCLYTAGVCAASGGKLAPVGLLLVTIMLFYFRLVYSEVVTALPVNGGSYNLLLNTTNKKVSAFVACLSLLSYTATAIVSAFDSIVYLTILWPGVDIRGFTVLVLVVFAGITLCGVKESSTATLFLFSLHFITISVLVGWGFLYGIFDGFMIFKGNMNTSLPDIVSSEGHSLASNSIAASIYFGYASALLGITGFETASNYVEEMESPQVFVWTVNGMWLLAGVFNPLLSLVSMMVLTMETIYAHPSDMLAEMAGVLGGKPFKFALSVDAVLILCGGVLTAIVGVSKLLERLAKDKVVPEYLAINSTWGSPYVAIISFTVFCISLFLCIFDPTNPTGIKRFGGVFAIAFLSVLGAFAFAALLLKIYRSTLPRLVITKWWQVVFSLLAVTVGLIGNIVLTPDVFVWFLVYLVILIVIVGYMFIRVQLFSAMIWIIQYFHHSKQNKDSATQKQEQIKAAYEQQYHFDEFGFLYNREGDSSLSLNTISLQDNGSGPKESYHPSFMRMDSDENSAGKQQGKILSYLSTSLDRIVTQPFGFFAKHPNPISLHIAIEYIVQNEESDSIFIVHFVDDRKFYDTHKKCNQDEGEEVFIKESFEDEVSSSVEMKESCGQNGHSINNETQSLFLRRMLQHGATLSCVDDLEGIGLDLLDQHRTALPEEAQQLIDYVAILDTCYTFKKIHSIIVRGAYFCPAVITAVTNYLTLKLNCTIMGVPDTYFKFPFSKISGCRLVVQNPPVSVSRTMISRLAEVIKSITFAR